VRKNPGRGVLFFLKINGLLDLFSPAGLEPALIGLRRRPDLGDWPPDLGYKGPE